jgi:hypothetical protein
MLIESIKNHVLKDLVVKGRQASETVTYDLDDALQSSTTDEELIHSWQSVLEDLKSEVEYYWGSLEELKNNTNNKNE